MPVGRMTVGWVALIAIATSAATFGQAATSAPTGAEVASGLEAADGAGLIRRGVSATNGSAQVTDSVAGSASRVTGSLAVVLGLIVLMYWAARRLLPRSALDARSSGGGAVVVLAKTHLSAKQRILVLQVGRRVLVVGDSGPGGHLSTLCEIDDPDEAAALIGQIHGSAHAGRSFASLFGSAREKLAAPPAERPADSAPPQDIESARRQLDGLMRQVRGLTQQIDRT